MEIQIDINTLWRCFELFIRDGHVIQLLSCIWLFVTLWTVAHQVPPSTGCSRQEYWSQLPCPPPGDLHDPGIEHLLHFRWILYCWAIRTLGWQRIKSVNLGTKQYNSYNMYNRDKNEYLETCGTITKDPTFVSLGSKKWRTKESDTFLGTGRK